MLIADLLNDRVFDGVLTGGELRDAVDVGAGAGERQAGAQVDHPRLKNRFDIHYEIIQYTIFSTGNVITILYFIVKIVGNCVLQTLTNDFTL